MTARVRVLVYAVVPDDSQGAVDAAYHRISRDLQDTPGLLANELLRSIRDRRRFVIMSEWESLAAFRAWEGGPGHRLTTAPLRPLQDTARGSPYDVYELQAAY